MLRITWGRGDARPGYLALGLLGFTAFLAVFLAFAVLGWPGQVDGCTAPGGNCYCEAPRTSSAVCLVRQPANTWSNLAPVVAGLALLGLADRERARPRRSAASANPMLRGEAYAAIYGGLVVTLGAGSMAFHGSLTRIGGWLDTLSMIAFVSFVLLYDGARILRADLRTFASCFIGCIGVLGIFTWVIPDSAIWIFQAAVLLVVGVETGLVARGLRGIRRSPSPWLPLSVAAFAAGLVIWRLSWTNAPLCDPYSLLQGHALWHVLAEAVAPLFLFQHLRAERKAS